MVGKFGSLPAPESYRIAAEIAVHEDKAIYRAEDEDGGLCILKVFGKTYKYPLYEALAKLEHANMPRIREAVLCGQYFYVVEEWVDGSTLRDILERDGALETKAATDILTQLCDVLTYLHNQSPPIIHRDITPANIMITGGGTVKLLDFDIAREYKSQASADTELVGTKPFAPPEQYGFAQSDHRADIYALGMLLTVMLTNTYDVQRITDTQIKSVAQRCMRVAPGERFQSAKKLRYKLERIDGGKRGLPARLILATAAAAAIGIVVQTGFGSAQPSAPAPDFVNISAPQSPVYSGWSAWVTVFGGISEDGYNAEMLHLDPENFVVTITSDPPAYDTFLILDSMAAPPPYDEFIFTPVEVHLDPANREDRVVSVTVAYLGFEETAEFQVLAYAATNAPDVVIVDHTSPDGAESVTLTRAAVRRHAEAGQAMQIILLQGTVLLDALAVYSIGQTASYDSIRFELVSLGDDLEFVITSGGQTVYGVEGSVSIIRPIEQD
ncbi:MAG: serine/threonine protein kinase [Defluviitaleaceae bacterium]|nr:serine/threonine protein kinase [Defluviitaleaceae bacterium]